MDNISINQALSIWGDLWQAYFGKNGYGGDTAEIYAYRLMPNEPCLFGVGDYFKERQAEVYRNAAYSLRDIVWKFCQDNDVLCLMDGENCDDWVRHTIFDHRCHIKVIHKADVAKA